MLSYAPIDDTPPRDPVTKKSPPPLSVNNKIMKTETECSYLVMFFIVGTIVLALTDMN